MNYITKCPLCGTNHTIENLSEEEVSNISKYRRRLIGLYEVFSPENNTALNRELIKTGICQECWDEMFGDED